MNNDFSQTLRLDEQCMPTTDMQRFVDDLVRTYEQRALKAKVVQIDAGDRGYNTLLNLDATDVEPAEEDVIAARIFPKQKCEKAREDLLKELDTAVENYATMVGAYSKVVYSYMLRAYLVGRLISQKVYRVFRAYSTRVYLRQVTLRTQREHVVTGNASRIHEENTTLHGSRPTTAYALETVSVATVRPMSDTLTYSYMVSPSNAQAWVEYNAKTATSASHKQTPQPDVETTHEIPVLWGDVAECLYTQFRYGPKHLR